MLADAPIVDCHCHIFHAGMPFREDAWTRPDYEYPVETYLAELDRHGIAFGVIAAASLWGDYNDYTLAALDTHKRLRATVMLDPETSLAEIRSMRDRGVVGVRLQWKADAALPDLRGHSWGKFLNRLADCGMHTELNCSADQLAHVLPILGERDLDIVVDHFGLLRSPEGVAGAGFTEVLRSLERDRTWVKISAGFRIDPVLRAQGFARLLDAAGPGRLLWGTDAPFVGMEETTSFESTIAIFEEMVPDPAIRRAISDAALRFYFF